jgi:L-iditol 2-dehydrogenase
MDVSEQRLDLHRRLRLPFDNLINSGKVDPKDWVKKQTHGRGVDAVIVAASVKPLVSLGMKLLAKGGHLSVFAGMPKSNPVDSIDLNLIHYNEFNIHGATSSARQEYLSARDYIVSGKIDGAQLVTHRFPLDEFREAVATQADPSTGALKVVIIPQEN